MGERPQRNEHAVLDRSQIIDQLWERSAHGTAREDMIRIPAAQLVAAGLEDPKLRLPALPDGGYEYSGQVEIRVMLAANHQSATLQLRLGTLKWIEVGTQLIPAGLGVGGHIEFPLNGITRVGAPVTAVRLVSTADGLRIVLVWSQRHAFLGTTLIKEFLTERAIALSASEHLCVHVGLCHEL